MKDAEQFLEIQNNGWNLSAEIWEKMTDYDRSFAASEFGGTRTKEFYQQRLRSIGFEGKDRVLDAACGMGQWSLVLGELNQNVVGIDLNTSRIELARKLSRLNGKANCKFRVEALEKIDEKDESFDAIFCYGSFMFSRMSECLAEFQRILKPGGVVYLNANALGWYAHMILDLGIRNKNWNVARMGFKMVQNRLFNKGTQSLVTKSDIRSLCEKSGFKSTLVGQEGHLSVNNSPPLLGYPRSYYGLTSIWEALTYK